MSDERLTVKEYAARFRLHVQTVYIAIRNGILPHQVVRIGKSIRIIVPADSQDRISA
jgi:excisionase family DNA binding protein